MTYSYASASESQVADTRAFPKPEWLNRLVMPKGFQIEVWAQVPNPRQMTYANGVLYVGSFQRGEVNAIKVNPDQTSGRVINLVRGENSPVGVTIQGDTLYYSAVSSIKKIEKISAVIEGRTSAKPEPLPLELPKDRAHGWKFIDFGPDGHLYIPQGAPCNVCEVDPQRYANIARYNLKTGELKTIASGIRNSVGFAWNPKDASLWATSNNRDWMGDDMPPDVLLRISKEGEHFGFPYCHAGKYPDPEFGNKRACTEFAPTAIGLGAHVAPLGIAFYQQGQFPQRYADSLFIAEHGSWNRSTKSGYRITMVRIQGDKAVKYEPFITGFNEGDTVYGRPADLEFLSDGSLLISDDAANLIYRVSHLR